MSRTALIRGCALALGAAVAVAAVVLGAYGGHGAVQTLLILAPLGLATVGVTHWVLAHRDLLGSVRRQSLVTATLALGPLVVTLALFVQMMFVSAHDALLAGLAAIYSGLLGLWAGRLLSRQVMADMDGRRAESEAARRALIAAVSHDLRTPVTALRLLAEAVDDEIGDPETRREYVRRLGVHVRALGGLIDDLFELTQIEAGAVAWTMSDIDLDELVEDTVAAMQPAAAAAGGIAVRARIDPSLVPARANPERIQRVLFNLIQNAIRHTPADGSVTVRAARAGDGDSVEIEVADTGSGIAAADRERIFEVFQQGADRAARTDGSAGLGLAISRAIVEAHGGRIWVVDDDAGGDAGARVRFSLPTASAA
jgi:signal transduction histidine kinase